MKIYWITTNTEKLISTLCWMFMLIATIGHFLHIFLGSGFVLEIRFFFLISLFYFVFLFSWFFFFEKTPSDAANFSLKTLQLDEDRHKLEEFQKKEPKDSTNFTEYLIICLCQEDAFTEVLTASRLAYWKYFLRVFWDSDSDSKDYIILVLGGFGDSLFFFLFFLIGSRILCFLRLGAIFF